MDPEQSDLVPHCLSKRLQTTFVGIGILRVSILVEIIKHVLCILDKRYNQICFSNYKLKI